MAVRKTGKQKIHPLTPRQSAAYTQDILGGLGRLASGNSQALLAHLLDMARKEATWLSEQ